ncbi:DNA repair protein SWI5 homolog, partial [Bubalus kerabau]|uniref:DNA repair protein SWI5 homolog n=1 Tax=Bubalus carabanensis TaxID=3119969 RepID=UPI00244EADFE
LRFVTFLVSVRGFQVPGRPEEALFRPRPGPSFSAAPPESGAPDARAEEDSTRTFQKLRRGLPIPCFREETAFLSFVSVTPDPTKGLCLSSSLTSPQVRPSPKPGQADRTSKDSLQLDIQKLKEKKDMLDKEISQLLSEGYSVDELEDHISQLHEYNDIKDAAQMLLGRLVPTIQRSEPGHRHLEDLEQAAYRLSFIHCDPRCHHQGVVSRIWPRHE